MKKICLIPARYDATRFPGKLMKTLGGRAVIRVSYENVRNMDLFDEVYVVTNSAVIRNEIESHKGKVAFFETQHTSGSDRIAEAVAGMEADIVINVQGDEPFIRRESLSNMILALEKAGPGELMVSSLMRRLSNEAHLGNTNVVKVVVDTHDRALYFSRSVIPNTTKSKLQAQHYEHIGVYGFTRSALMTFSRLEPTPLELAESVECLRFLENGIPMYMVRTDAITPAIDTEEDLVRAQTLLDQGKLVLY